MQNHNDTIKTSATVLRKYTSYFIWKGCVWEGVGDQTELQHTDPHSIDHNYVSFSFSKAAQPGAQGPSLSGCWFSLPHLISNSSDPQLSIGGLRTLSAGCRLIFSWSGLQTNWLPVFTELFNSSTSLLLVCVTIALIQPVHGQGYYSTGFTCYLHWCISYFDSPAGS